MAGLFLIFGVCFGVKAVLVGMRMVLHYFGVNPCKLAQDTSRSVSVSENDGHGDDESSKKNLSEEGSKPCDGDKLLLQAMMSKLLDIDEKLSSHGGTGTVFSRHARYVQ